MTKKIDWSKYDPQFVEWLFDIYKTEEKMPNEEAIILMSSAFAKGTDVGYIEGFNRARKWYNG